MGNVVRDFRVKHSINSVRTGLDILLENRPRTLKGLNLGLVANQTSVGPGFGHSLFLLSEAGFRIQAVFGPEHGVFGAAQDMIPVPASGAGKIPVHSLYGKTRDSLMPTERMLAGLDALVFDIQDIGTRYYTFISTMSLCMEQAGRMGLKFIVLDRPNPINGTRIEGNMVRQGMSSFVGLHPVAARHGMTVGELATLFRDGFGVRCDLEIIRMKGWRREMWHDQTGLDWINPSPNMPWLNTALVYPGACLVEGTNLSEGRGTTRPFEYIGAPFIDSHALADALNREDLPGVLFRPAHFTPAFHKWAGKLCGGIQYHITDRDAFRPFISGIALLRAVRRLCGRNFALRKQPYEFERKRRAIDLLLGDPALWKMVCGASLEEIRDYYRADERAFENLRKP
jgi:uncharacterized protein YbbC (DUF1343 family)